MKRTRSDELGMKKLAMLQAASSEELSMTFCWGALRWAQALFREEL